MTPNRAGTIAAVPGQELPKSGEVQAYGFGPFRLLPGERILRRGDQALPLPPKAFDTLLLLVCHPGHLMSKGELMKALWPDSFVEEVNLANNISLLRKVLRDKAGACSFIQTVPKLGYRFLPAVTSIWKRSSPAGSCQPRLRTAPADRAIRFIALPFRLVHGDERIDFLGRSLPEAISASLAGLRSMTVRSSMIGGAVCRRPAGPETHRAGSGGGSAARWDDCVRRRRIADQCRTGAGAHGHVAGVLCLPDQAGQHLRSPGQPGAARSWKC